MGSVPVTKKYANDPPVIRKLSQTSRQIMIMIQSPLRKKKQQCTIKHNYRGIIDRNNQNRFLIFLENFYAMTPPVFVPQFS